MNFFERHKTIILFLALIITAIGLGFLIYNLFFKDLVTPPPVAETGNQEQTEQAGFPSSASGTKPTATDKKTTPKEGDLPTANPSEVASGGLTAVKEIGKDPVLSPTLSSDGNSVRFYDKKDSKFYRIDKNGELELMADKIFHGVENVVWAAKQEKAVIEYPDGSNILYDFSSQNQVTLPKHWEDFDFSPQDDKLVLKSIALDKENNVLAISNADGSGVRAIEPLGNNENTVYADWSPNNQIIAMYIKGIDFNRQEVFFLGQNKENFKSTVVEGRGFEPKWSPQGDRLLYSVYSTDNGMKPGLWVVNSQGDEIGSNRKNLKIDTWASKCAFADQNDLYCAVPESLPEGAGVFPELAESTNDRLYKIDPRTGSKKLIAVPDGTFNMSSLIISNNKYYLYFTDKQTGKLHQIKLK